MHLAILTRLLPLPASSYQPLDLNLPACPLCPLAADVSLDLQWSPTYTSYTHAHVRMHTHIHTHTAHPPTSTSEPKPQIMATFILCGKRAQLEFLVLKLHLYPYHPGAPSPTHAPLQLWCVSRLTHRCCQSALAKG